MVRQAVDRFGRIDALVDKRRAGRRSMFRRPPFDTGWHKTVELNLTSVVLTLPGRHTHLAVRSERPRWVCSTGPRVG